MNEPAPISAALPALSPGQENVYRQVIDLLEVVPIVVIMGSVGCGKTLLLQHLAKRRDSELIDVETIVDACRSGPADAWDEAARACIEAALERSSLVVIDDFHLVAAVSARSATRGGYFSSLAARQLVAKATRNGKRLVFAGYPPQSWENIGDIYGDFVAPLSFPNFTPADYRAIANNLVGEARTTEIDFHLLYHYAALLNGHQLRILMSLQSSQTLPLTCESLIETLGQYVLTSNTRISEVENLTFDRLPGSESIVEALETHIVLPFENRKLAARLDLKPKRGVLLYGPPGTGKTSIGRALAHRMKGKFFLIDGDFISEPPNAFFGKLQGVINEAKESAPSILFIDDADLLFKVDHIAGLERFLLSLLDGLESESSRGVCVMMTATNPALLPDALLRSGRVELWLSTQLPDSAVRGRILQRWVEDCHLPKVEAIAYETLAEASAGFTPADLRRVVDDAKALYAMDIARERPLRQANDYLQEAIDDFTRLRDRMADGLGDDSLRVGRSYPVVEGGDCASGACGW